VPYGITQCYLPFGRGDILTFTPAISDILCALYTVVGGTVDVATLSQIIVNRIRDLNTTPEELKDAFQVFDKQGTGMISVHDLKLSLTTLGERLADEELDELIREVDQDGEGMVNYQGVTDYCVIAVIFFVSTTIIIWVTTYWQTWNTHNHFTALCVSELGELVPEETFTHSHLS